VIHNAEISLFRVDPSRYGGREGFSFAIDRSGRPRMRSKVVYKSYEQAAQRAGRWLDEVEQSERRGAAPA
jgi:hypothetical protein